MLTAARFLAAAVLLAWLVAARSEPPLPSPRKDRQPQQEHPAKADDKGGYQPKNSQQSSPVKNAIPSGTAQQHRDDQTSNGEKKTFFGYSIEAISALITAIATGVIAWFTVALSRSTKRLWKEAEASGRLQIAATNAAGASANAANRTAKTMEETAERRLRAYVGIDSVILESGLRPRDEIRVTIAIKNFGHTPAYKCMASINCALLDFGGEPIDFPYDLDPEPISVIHPGATLVKSRIKKTPLTSDELTAFAESKKAIWLFGQITYDVAFKIPRRTSKFCYLITGEQDFVVNHFGLSAYGNDAD